MRTGGQRREYALAVGPRQLHRSHRRAQIGHDDGARELARGVRQHRGERGTVAQMQVPVVGAGKRENLWNESRHGRRNYTRRQTRTPTPSAGPASFSAFTAATRREKFKETPQDAAA